MQANRAAYRFPVVKDNSKFACGLRWNPHAHELSPAHINCMEFASNSRSFDEIFFRYALCEDFIEHVGHAELRALRDWRRG
jgi:hypothetical protein